MITQKTNKIKYIIKKCTSCNLEFPKTDEYFRKNGNFLRSSCKMCLNKNLAKKTIEEKKIRKAETHKSWCLINRPAKEKHILKTCGTCKLAFERTKENFRARPDGIKDKLRSQCIPCFDKKQRERHIEFYKNNTEKELLRHKTWCQNNKEKRALTVRKTYLKNIEKNKTYDKKRIDNLTDSIVKIRIRQSSNCYLHEIPQELIETKRLIIQLKRELKNN
jgi:hypothetical protein